MNQPDFTRRDFIKTSGAVAIGGAIASNLIIPSKSFAQNTETIKIGLIGCGGRGSGAAKNALEADKNVILVAMGDIFPDQLEKSFNNLKADKEVGARVQVPAENRYVGFDAYKKVVDSGVDVVLLATPPGFRAYHIKYAVEKNKHVFCEKPVCTDAFGYRSFIETAKASREKKLALVAGFCWRSNLAERAVYEKVLGGDIGEVRSIYGTYNTGEPRAIKLDPTWSPMETQLRNWMQFTWLSGDHIVEQAVHNVDLTNWAMNNQMPVKCIAHGGRQIRPNPMFGHIFDHFSVVYEWANGVKGFLFCRQQSGCASDNTEHIYGTKGTAHVLLFNGIPYITDLQNKRTWKYSGEKNTPNMYVVEHEELFSSIRKGNPRNDGEWLANSSMMAVMGRMAGYTGQEVTWEDAINSQDKLVPDEQDITWDKAPEVPPLAIPGKTRFI
jgi:predicted dehydrogenase